MGRGWNLQAVHRGIATANNQVHSRTGGHLCRGTLIPGEQRGLVEDASISEDVSPSVGCAGPQPLLDYGRLGRAMWEWPLLMVSASVLLLVQVLPGELYYKPDDDQSEHKVGAEAQGKKGEGKRSRQRTRADCRHLNSPCFQILSFSSHSFGGVLPTLYADLL